MKGTTRGLHSRTQDNVNMFGVGVQILAVSNKTYHHPCLLLTPSSSVSLRSHRNVTLFSTMLSCCCLTYSSSSGSSFSMRSVLITKSAFLPRFGLGCFTSGSPSSSSPAFLRLFEDAFVADGVVGPSAPLKSLAVFLSWE